VVQKGRASTEDIRGTEKSIFTSVRCTQGGKDRAKGGGLRKGMDSDFQRAGVKEKESLRGGDAQHIVRETALSDGIIQSSSENHLRGHTKGGGKGEGLRNTIPLVFVRLKFNGQRNFTRAGEETTKEGRKRGKGYARKKEDL